VKRRVLTAEGLDLERLERFAESGVRYLGSDTTRIVCHPTCYHARRIGDAHRVTFRSLGQARAAGYRPCRDCRPIALAA
jgi:methylphosphotriester-DNA--protein-cysteine methyltransferase